MKILTFNIWFDYQYQKERTKGLCKYINDNRPDLVALQEVTKPVYEIIKNSLENSYFISDMWDIGNSSYGTISLVNRDTFKSVAFERIPYLNTTMNRDMLLSKTSNITLINTHLESLDTHLIRESQMNQINSELELNSTNRFIIAGDFNFDANKNHPKSSSKELDNNSIKKYLPNFRDSWTLLNIIDPGYTFDTQTNHNLSRSLWEDRSRYDRILVNENLSPIDIHILDISVSTLNRFNIPLSDHYGLIMKF